MLSTSIQKNYLLLLCCFLHNLMAMEVIPTRAEVEYYNPKYIASMNISVRRYIRRGPYTAKLDFLSLDSCGNNVTIKVQIFEHISGRYIPTIFMVSGLMCNFLYNNALVGKIVTEQQPANFTCPIPAGKNQVRFQGHNRFDNFPLYLSFVYDSVITQVRCDFTGHLVATNELIFIYNVYLTLIQKPKEKV